MFGLESYQFPMDVNAIQKCIPHRFPFLFLERIISATAFDSIVAQRNISISDQTLQGHFPGNPILPGVLIVEGAAQAAAVLGCISKGGLNECMFTEITEARFRRPVVPGDVLVYNLKMTKYRGTFFWFDGDMTVDGKSVATVKFSALMK